ncbi:ATP-binding protein [Methylococcus geothermalis]|uniref:ATP-binding protein n=1 Tax=Methylococcus geothermalis TaxID=2681310 RepID=A0A858Q7S3_9GAMM|nr:ATP-binding protein [Methylococcus geothermalis]QJD29952.1 ATP-binding protein [Methylococcus geothermalis]
MEPNEPDAQCAQFERTIDAGIEPLIEVMEQLESFCTASGVPEAVAVQLNLVLEELATNTIKYGYPAGKSGKIEICLTLHGGLASLTVADDGNEFDPTTSPAPDVYRQLEERAIGGLGIHLVMRMMDSVTYHRHGGKNIVTVSKNTRPANGLTSVTGERCE